METSEKLLTIHIEEFLQYINIEKGLAFHTQKSYKINLYKFKDWLEKQGKESIKAHELTNEDVWQYRLYLNQLQSSGVNKLSKKTQNYILTTLRGLLYYFAIKDIPALSPQKITLSKTGQDQKLIKFLEIDDIKKILNAPGTNSAVGLRDRAIFETLFSTGLRVAEIVALNREQFVGIWNQEDYALGIIGKGNYPRTVFFSKQATYWIKRYLKASRYNYGPLFLNIINHHRGENRMTTRSLERLVKNYANETRLPSFVTPHTFRHSHATYLLNQGADLRIVQEFLGHRNIATTQIYTHVTNKRLREVHRQYYNNI